MKCEQKPKQVILQSANQPLDFQYKDGRAFFFREWGKKEKILTNYDGYFTIQGKKGKIE